MALNQGPWAFKLLSSFKPDHMELRISCLLMTKGCSCSLVGLCSKMLLRFFSPYSFNLFASLSICETFGALSQTNSSKDK
jgi:hypothetical protein